MQPCERGSQKSPPIINQPVNSILGKSPGKFLSNNIPSPIGLDLLTNLDQVLIQQTPELPEQMKEYETTRNRYNILIETGEIIFYAVETTDANTCCKGSERPFEITIFDTKGTAFMRINRSCDLLLHLSGCWPCCCCWLGRLGGKVTVTLSNGTFLGEIIHGFRPCYYPTFQILDPQGLPLIRLGGQCCSDCCCCISYEFQVRSKNGYKIGSVNQGWGGNQLALLASDADSFTVKMDVDLEATSKALIIASVFLIDFMYFEITKKNTSSHVRIPRFYAGLTKQSSQI